MNILDQIRAAYASEWLAHHQYRLGATLIALAAPTEVVEELLVHAEEELEHSDVLATMILNLGGAIPLPSEWSTLYPFTAPSSNPATLLQQLIDEEQKAIEAYGAMTADPRFKASLTSIRAKEIEHLNDLIQLQDGL